MKNRADIARRLEALERLAQRSSFKGERDAAAAKVAELRQMLGIMPTRSERRQHVGSHFVDVSDTADIKGAFKKAFERAFDDIRTTMRAEGTFKRVPKEDDPETIVRRMGMKVRYK